MKKYYKQKGGYNVCQNCKLKLENNKNIDEKDMLFKQNKNKKYQIYVKFYETIGVIKENVDLSLHLINDYIRFNDTMISKIYLLPENSIFLCPIYNCSCCKTPLDFQLSLTGKVEKKDNFYNEKIKDIYNQISHKLDKNNDLTSFHMFSLIKNCIKREILEEIGLMIKGCSLYDSIKECFLKKYLFEKKGNNRNEIFYFLFLNIDNCDYYLPENLDKKIMPEMCKKVFEFQKGGSNNNKISLNSEEMKNSGFESFSSYPNNTKIRIIVTLYFTEDGKINNFIYRPQFKYISNINDEYYDLLSIGLLNQKSYLNLVKSYKNNNKSIDVPGNEKSDKQILKSEDKINKNNLDLIKNHEL